MAELRPGEVSQAAQLREVVPSLAVALRHSHFVAAGAEALQKSLSVLRSSLLAKYFCRPPLWPLACQ